MSAPTTTLTQPAARFQAVRLPGGWTVADLLSGTAIVHSRPWDQAEADAVTGALNGAPGYVALFRWAALDERELLAAAAGVAAPGRVR